MDALRRHESALRLSPIPVSHQLRHALPALCATVAEARISTDQLISLRQKFTEQSSSGTVEQADIYAIATAGLEDGSGPGIPSSAVDKVLQ